MKRRDFDRGFPGPVLGIDEVGVGAIAGPLTACGLVLPGNKALEEALEDAGAKDSKRITETRREYLANLIHENYVWYFICSIEASEYKQGHMTQHLDKLFREILLEAKLRGPGFGTIIIDGSQGRDLEGHHFKAIAKADDKSLAVACASIMAKTHRDGIMRDLGNRYTAYKFERHKGYPTDAHKGAIAEYGALPGVHRRCKAVTRIIASRQMHRGEGCVDDWSDQLLRGAGVASSRRLRCSGRFR